MGRELALEGGTPLRTSPFPTWPAPGDEEVAAVTRVVRSAQLTYWAGEQGRLLEREYSEAVGRAHGVAVANGTLALELALRSFGVGPGHDVIVPARTFIATASSVVAVGARPVVADIDTTSNNVTAKTIADAFTDRTRAIIPVHVGGWPVEIDPILRLAADRDVIVIEDCAQAHGATYQGRPVGSAGSHAAAFSFCQDKIVSAGEGGMLVLDDDEAYERAWSYKDHGKSLRRVEESRAAGSPGTTFCWQIESFGSNWRIAEMSAALARVGLSKLPEWHAARTRNALRLVEGVQGISALNVPMPAEGSEHGLYRLYASVEANGLAPGWDRDRIASAILAEGIPCQYGACAEIYRETAFVKSGLAPTERLPGASAAHRTSLAFFVHPSLQPTDIDDMIAAVQTVMEAASL